MKPFKLARLGFMLLVAASLLSCNEDAIVKSSLTPAVDNIHTFGIGPEFNNNSDTITMITKTWYEDSIITSTRGISLPIYHSLGWVTDPYAGTTAGSIFMQFVPTITGFSFPTTAVVDSLVLALPYAGFTWGDTTTKSSRMINVYTINEAFSKDSVFFNFSKLSTNMTSVGSAQLVTGPTGSGVIQDATPVNGVNKASHLRVRLNDAFKALFLNALKADSSYASFTTAFPGLLIAPDTSGSGQALSYFVLNSGGSDIYSQAGIIAYTHTTGGSDTVVYQFPYNEAQCAHFNRITRNYYNPPSGAASLFQSTAANDRLVMMQNGPGGAVDIWLPYIQKLPKYPIIRAELVLTALDTAFSDKYFGPARLYPIGVNESGLRYSIADRYPTGSLAPLEFMGGTPNRVVRNGVSVTEYRINIPREVQNTIVQGKQGLHLRIGGTANYPGAYRVVLGGRGHTDPLYRASLNIIYSKQ